MRRDIYQQLQHFIDDDRTHKNVLLVEGARQVGKSTMVMEVLSTIANRQYRVINLEESPMARERIDQCADFANFDFLIRESFGFRPEAGGILFIDEAQESKKLGGFVRFMKEKWSHATVILSGSSMTRLFDGTRVPVGRCEYLRVFPFAFDEFLRALDKEHLLQSARDSTFTFPDVQHDLLLELYDQYLDVGGLPAVVTSFAKRPGSREFETLREEIYIAQKDDFHRKEHQLKTHLFDATVKAVARSLASPFKLTSITDNHRDAKAALEQMVQWHLVALCEQQGLAPTSNFAPKAYLYDVGLAKALRATALPRLTLSTTDDPALRTALGGLIENAVFLSLLSGKGFLHPPSGWRKDPKNPVEVDFIYRVDDTAVPIEVKASRRTNLRFCASLWDYMKLTKSRKGILISAAPFNRESRPEGTIVHLPVYFANADVIRELAR